MKKRIKLNEALTISTIGISSMMIYSQADLFQEKLVIKKELDKTNEKVLEVTLNNGENLPDLNANGEGYTKIVVITVNNKKLDATDFTKLKESNIPNIDLSNAYAEIIPHHAFIDAEWLKSFEFPQGVTKISTSAFYNCSSWEGELVIPDTVKTIEYGAFNRCSSLTGDLVIPDSVNYLGQVVFAFCSGLNGKLKIGAGLSELNNGAFQGCSGLVGQLVIPRSVTVIKDWVFEGCSGFTGDLIIPDSIVNIGSHAFRECKGFNGDLIIPDSVLEIGSHCFYRSTGFKGKLVLSNSITEIKAHTFNACGFTGNLVIPDKVTSIGGDAFYNCSGFTGDLIIPNSVVSIGGGAFSGCHGFDGNLVIPESVTNIENRAFHNSYGFTGNLVIPSSLTEIQDGVFQGCRGFTKIILSESISSIGALSFYGCTGLSGNILIPKSIASIGENAFTNCPNIENIIISTGSDFIDSNYRKSIIDNLDKNKTVIELSYNFDEAGTWLETTNFKKSKPIPIKVTDGIEDEYDGEAAQSIVLNIPFLDENAKINALKDGKEYRLSKSVDGKYIFDKSGNYEVNIETSLGTISNINFIVDEYIIDYENAENTADEALKNPTVENLENSRDLINKLPEGEKKEQLQELINNIFPNITLEKKVASANLDVYIKSENMLSMSLDTNSVTFEDYSGVEPMEKLDAVNITINSSLPYSLNAYMPSEIANSDKSKILPIDILNIRESSEIDYKQFANTTDKVVLKDNCIKGNDINHSIDLKLDYSNAHKADVYKTVIKFEAQQK